MERGRAVRFRLHGRSVPPWLLLAVFLLQTAPTLGQDFLLVQSGTTLRDSGFFEAVLPAFTRETGVEVRVVAVGTGQALQNARRGDADLLLTHSKSDEEQFVDEGYGLDRRDVMYNKFVVIGPASDPAGVGSSRDVVASFRKVAGTGSYFASRGDDSGTHKAELRYWAEAGVDVESGDNGWYRSLGAGMGATLNAGIAMGAYVLTDEATWLAFGNKKGYRVWVADDPRLHNQYGIVLVRPLRDRVDRLGRSRLLFDWIVSESGQGEIACFRIAGRQAYAPNRGAVGHDCSE